MISEIIEGILVGIPGPTLFKKKSSRLSNLGRFLAGAITLVSWPSFCVLLSRYVPWFELSNAGIGKKIFSFIIFVFLGIAIYWLALSIAGYLRAKSGANQVQEPQRLNIKGEAVVFISTFGSFLIISVGGLYLLRMFPGAIDIPGMNFVLLGISSSIAIFIGAVAIIWCEKNEFRHGIDESDYDAL